MLAKVANGDLLLLRSHLGKDRLFLPFSQLGHRAFEEEPRLIRDSGHVEYSIASSFEKMKLLLRVSKRRLRRMFAEVFHEAAKILVEPI